MEDFFRIRRLPPYVFEQVNRAKAAARNGGADIIDLGMGNPDLPAPRTSSKNSKRPSASRVPTVTPPPAAFPGCGARRLRITRAASA